MTISASGDGAPRDAQLKAYHSAQWACFAFAVFGSILALIFLRGVGIVGHRKIDAEKMKEDVELAKTSDSPTGIAHDERMDEKPDPEPTGDLKGTQS